MARTYRARSQAVDNIAVGSAISSQERTINGALPPATATWGNTENIAVGTDYSADENIVATATNLLLTERLG
jgi:hypothetical protein